MPTRLDILLALIQDQDICFHVLYHGDVPRFFLELHERDCVLIDEHGLDLSDVDAARVRALHEVRHLMAADIIDGLLCLDNYIEVQDEHRNMLLTIVFKDAVTFQHKSVNFAFK